MKRTIFTLVILLIMASVMSTSLIADGTEPPKVSGVYQVSILDHLLWISTNSGSWGADFIQTANIDATDTQNWNSGAGFSPIGNFTGSYDGQNHTITGLYINRDTNDEVALFGNNLGTIKNIGLEDIDITGYYPGYHTVGGLVGWNWGTITNSYATGNVSISYWGGGLVGVNRGTITNSYATVNVSGHRIAGGLVGWNYATVSNSYATGIVTGTSPGGLVGVNYGTISNSYYDKETSGQSDIGKGEPKTTAEMQTQSTFTSAGWDFIDIWVMDGYPVFQGDCPPFSVDAGSDITIYYGYGAGTATLTVTAEGGNGQYSYMWSNNATTQTITVNPTTTTIYTVTVTDECNNTASDEVIVDVIDVRCGKNNNKVLVCHKGNTICISPNAVQTHLNNHGDYLGNCGDQILELPKEYELHYNYPNPFNPMTRIDYALPFDSKVSIQIFDVLGREVVTLVNENQRAGYYTVDFNASNLASGIYFYRMIAGDFTAIQKMVLIK